MRAPRLLILGVAVAVVLATASIAAATFTSAAATGPMALSSATLNAPGGISASAGCVKNVSVSVSLSWSASNFASGYTIYRSSGAGFSQLATVGSGTTSYTDVTAAYSTTYSYYVVATFQSWTAQSSTSSATTLSKLCK